MFPLLMLLKFLFVITNLIAQVRMYDAWSRSCGAGHQMHSLNFLAHVFVISSFWSSFSLKSIIWNLEKAKYLYITSIKTCRKKKKTNVYSTGRFHTLIASLDLKYSQQQQLCTFLHQLIRLWKYYPNYVRVRVSNFSELTNPAGFGIPCPQSRGIRAGFGIDYKSNFYSISMDL